MAAGQRSSRWWIGVGIIAVVGGLVAFFAATLVSGDEKDGRSIGVDTVEPGTPGRPAALWLLGRASLRFGPVTLRGGQLLNVQPFGSVLGAVGRVDLFDPQSGRLGAIDSRRNELVDFGSVSVEPESEFAGDPVIADTGDSIWLVTGPNQVTRFRVADRRSTRIELPADAQGPTTATRVVANGASVYAVSTRQSGGGLVSRIDPATGTITGSGPLPPSVGDTDLAVRSLTADDLGVWVFGSRAMVRLDPSTLQVRQASTYDPALELYEAVAADRVVWGLDEASSQLVRLDADGSVAERFPTRSGRGKLPLPADLVADDESVWVLAPVAPTTGFGAERLTRVDTRRNRISGRFESPANLSIGAIAVSSR